RHGDRGARHHALRRTAAARGDRPRARRRPAHPDPRRRDRVGRRDDRVAHPRGPSGGDARPDDDHRRAPPFDDRARGRDRRARARARRRTRRPRRPRRDERRVPRDLRARDARARVRRGGCLMRVHQPGGHLTRGRGAQVDDWSWARTKRRLATLYRLARPYKARTSIAILALLAATAVSLAPPFLVGRAVDEVRHGRTTTLIWIVAAFVGAGVLGIGATYGQTYFTGWTGERMLADLRNLLFRHLQRLSLGFYERNRAGVIISRLTNDVEALDQLVTDGVTSLIQNTLTLLGTAVVLFFLDWRLALATMTVMPLMAAATAWFRKRSGRAYREVRETLGAVTATLAEDIAGMRVLQSFTREDPAQDNFREVSDTYRASNMQTVVLNGIYFPIVDFLSTAATAVVLGYGGWLAYHGHVTIGTLVAFLGYLSNFFDPVQQLSSLYNTFLSAVAALDKITDLLDEEPEVRDTAGATDLERIAGRVAFEGVRFAYGRGPEVLHGIDLDVPAGTTVALVGHTGAGKSTIAKLIARFYDPTDGRLTIDGVDLR